jgi:hypothetical protein
MPTSTSPILGITHIADNQTGKATTANTGTDRLEASANDTLDIDFTSANQTVSLDDFQKHMRLRCINVTTPRTLTLQASKRELTIRSSSSNTAALTVVIGTTSFVLLPGYSRKIYANGTANGLEEVSNEPADLLGFIKGANFNSTSDQVIALKNQTPIRVRRITVWGTSVNGMSTAAGGVYTAASKGGTAIVGSGQAYTGLTNANTALDLTLAVSNLVLNAGASLYLSLTTPQGAAATANIAVYGDALPA